MDYREAFTTRTTFIDRKLASIYEVPAPQREGFGEITFPEGFPRAGLLGHLSVLALNSHPAASSATLRGHFVRATLLCGAIPPPPTNVDTSIPEPCNPDLDPTCQRVTLRDRVQQHLGDAFCAGCHGLMDPIGLGLENFDALGRYRVFDWSEEGAPPDVALIDASGDLAGVPFVDNLELGQAIADSEDLPACLTRTMYRYATGHIERTGETESLLNLNEAFISSGHRVKALMVEIALDPGFRLADDPELTVEGE